MGIRSLLLAATVWAIFLLVRRFRARPQTLAEPQPDNHSVDMIPCDHCGLHLPRTEAFQESGRHYCCREHREKARESHT
jgi:uncharacterized protein